MAEGHQARSVEFDQFEREFEHCLSQSATKTKFEQHCHRASKIIDSLYNKAQWLHVSMFVVSYGFSKFSYTGVANHWLPHAGM